MKRRTPKQKPQEIDRGVAAMFADLDEALRRAGDRTRSVHEKSYLKSPISHYGASVPAIRRAVLDTLRAGDGVTRRRLLSLSRALWASDVHEHRMAAVTMLEERRDLLRPADLKRVEKMIRGSFTWAYVDGLSGRVAGSLVERYPELAAELDRWARDGSFWVRRGALLALLGPIRRGGGDWKRFTRYADAMLDDPEFFIRKAIGWVLREASKARPERVRSYVAARLERLSGVTFREAVKRLPPTDRKALERSYRAARG